MDVKDTLAEIVEGYDSNLPQQAAERLKSCWLSFGTAEIHALTAADKAKQETAGVRIPDLKKVGKELAKHAGKDVERFMPLTRLLWDDYGREGRVVALLALGRMELKDPETIVPLLFEMCRSCFTWEDVDRLAMDALEPIVRKDPDTWLDEMDRWIDDDNKWVKRAGAIVVGRLPMKQEQYAARCVEMCERLLFDEDVDVKKGVSFAIRLCARGDVAPVRELLERHVPPENPVATWVLCDIIRSMTKSFLPEFSPVRGRYVMWLEDDSLSKKHRRSIESALGKLS